MAASWLEGSSEHRCHSPTRLYYLKTETLVHYLAPLQTFPSSFASLSAVFEIFSLFRHSMLPPPRFRRGGLSLFPRCKRSSYARRFAYISLGMKELDSSLAPRSSFASPVYRGFRSTPSKLPYFTTITFFHFFLPSIYRLLYIRPKFLDRTIARYKNFSKMVSKRKWRKPLPIRATIESGVEVSIVSKYRI